MLAVKLLHLKEVGIGPRTETCVNWGEPIVMVPCLHQGNIYIKRKLRVWRDKNCIPLVSPLTYAGRQTIPSHERRYRIENGNLRIMEWIYLHGTVFTRRQYLYQKEATGMETQEMYSPSRCKPPLTCADRQTIPSQERRYRVDNGNLRKLGWTYRHGTVFAPRQYLYQKEATIMERPEMYFTSRCKRPSYLCGPSNYPVSRELV